MAHQQLWERLVPLSHPGEAVHSAWSCSLGEMDVESLMRRVAVASWLWWHLCPACGVMWARSQLWASCSACEVLQVCFKCVVLQVCFYTYQGLCLGSSKQYLPPGLSKMMKLFSDLTSCSERRYSLFPKLCFLLYTYINNYSPICKPKCCTAKEPHRKFWLIFSLDVSVVSLM